jgi:GntR family transcriptional regulator
MRIVLSDSSGIALYEQIVEQLRTAILSGELKPGDPLPSLRKLAQQLRVSLITTTRAYNDLAAAGLLVNVQGKGSFVAEVDPELLRAQALSDLRTGVRAIVASAKGSAAIQLPELVDLIKKEWNDVSQ